MKGGSGPRNQAAPNARSSVKKEEKAFYLLPLGPTSVPGLLKARVQNTYFGGWSKSLTGRKLPRERRGGESSA